MPRIRQINPSVSAQAGIPARRVGAADIAGNAGAGLFAAGRTVTNAGVTLLEIQQRQEISDVQTKLAVARSNLATKFAQIKRDTPAGSPQLAQKLMDATQQATSGITANLSTRGGNQTATTGLTRLQADATRQAILAQADSAGEKAKQDFLVMSDSLQNIISGDPSQFQERLQDANDFIDKSSLPAIAKQRLRIDIQQKFSAAAVEGLIDVNAPLALKQLQSGKFDGDKKNGFFLDPREKDTLIRRAEVRIRANRAERRAREADARRLKRAEQETRFKGIIDKAVDGKVNASEIVGANLTASQTMAAVRFVEQIANTQGKTQETQTFAGLFNRIHLPKDDQNRINSRDELRQFIPGLNRSDFKLLQTEFDKANGKTSTPLSEDEKTFSQALNKAARGELTTPQITALKLPNSEKVTLLRINTKASSPAKRTAIQASNSADLIGRISDSDNLNPVSRTDIINEFSSGRISLTQYKAAINAFENIESPDGESLKDLTTQLFKTFLPVISDRSLSSVLPSPAGGIAQDKYIRFVHKKITEFRSDPKKDVFSLFDPTSPDYLGSVNVLSRFRVTKIDSARAAASFRRAAQEKKSSLKEIFGGGG